MTYLLTQMFLCLLVAALLGFLIGWALRSLLCRQKIAELEAAWQDRLAAASVVDRRDDLTTIEGIGPKIETLLYDNRIFTFADLAEAPVDRLKGVLRGGGDRFKMHDPTSWPDQAKLAAEERWDELQELQDILQGGRDS
jgi:nucleotidyltransferase/DNA polymerase involved in DNA repair